MKKRWFLLLTACFVAVLFSIPAFAGIGDWIAGTLFKLAMELLGFGSSVREFCWFCPIIETLMTASGQIAGAVYDKTQTFLLTLLGVGTLFFIAFKVGGMVVKLQEVDLMQFMGELFKVLGRVIIAAVIISSSTFLVEQIITPVLGLSIDFTFQLLDEAKVDSKFYKSVAKSLEYISTADSEIEKAKNMVSSYNKTNAVISPFLTQSLVAITARISANLVVGMAVGIVLLLTSGISSMVFMDFQDAASGGVIFVAFAMLYITVPFQIINLIVQLAFVLALLPIWVILWVFPVTAQYAKKAWDLFIHTCLTFMIFGVLLILVLKIIAEMLPNSDEILLSMIPGYDLIAAKKSNALSSSVLMTLALGFLCKELLKSAPELASRITSVYGTTVGDSAGVAVAASAGAVSFGVLGRTIGLGKAFTANGYDAMQSIGNETKKSMKKTFGVDKSLFVDHVLGGSDNTKAHAPNQMQQSQSAQQPAQQSVQQSVQQPAQQSVQQTQSVRQTQAPVNSSGKQG